MGVAIRPIVDSDEGFMRLMVLAVGRTWLQAGHEFDPSILMVYLHDWGREGDIGVVAELDGRELGTAWIRSFSYEDCGPGFVSPGVPELILGVEAFVHGQVEERLLEGLFLLARARKVAFVSVAVPTPSDLKVTLETFGFADAGFSDADDALQVLLACL